VEVTRGPRRRPRRNFAIRIEPLEARALLNATIDIDADGRLTFQSDPAIASALRVSEAAGVYTFDLGAAGPDIDVASNAAGLAVTGSGTRTATVAGPAALQLVALADSDSILLASSAVPVDFALPAAHVAVTLGDQSDPLGLRALQVPISVAGSGAADGDSLVFDFRGAHDQLIPIPGPDLVLRLAKDLVSLSNGAVPIRYSGISALTVYGTSTSGNGSMSYIIDSTADGVDTRFDLSTASNPQRTYVNSTSSDPSSRLSIVGGSINIVSSSSPVAYMSAPGATSSSGSVQVSGMTADTAIDIEGAPATYFSVFADGLPITASNFSVAPSGAIVFTAPAPQAGTLTFPSSSLILGRNVQAPPLTVESNTLTSTGAPLTDVVVATITTTVPGLKASDFTPSPILWGDGFAPEGGTVVADPADPMRFLVMGSHTYAQPGTYTPGVLVWAFSNTDAVVGNATLDVGGATILLTYNATQAPSQNALVVEGLASTPGSEPGIVDSATPPVVVVANAVGARVDVYATPTGGAPFLVGSGTTDRNGILFLTPDVPLADGRYTITAQAFDDATGRISALTTLNESLVVDTVAPQIVGVRFVPMRGEVVVTYRDRGGVDDMGTGMNFASVTSFYSYEFSRLANPIRGYRGPAEWVVSSVVGRQAPVGKPQRVAVKINGGRPIRGGTYLFTARSLYYEIRDRANNMLQGGFDGTFPSQGPGDFVARLSSLHSRVFPPRAAGAAPVTTRAAARASLAHARARHV
jgi:hypothetical protein